MQKKMCIEFNNTRCVKVNSKCFIARQHVFVSDIVYSKITLNYNFFSYERKTQIKENDTVNHTNTVIKCYLELKVR